MQKMRRKNTIARDRTSPSNLSPSPVTQTAPVFGLGNAMYTAVGMRAEVLPS